ncbi:hypothetical protein LP420_23465 [Massilia sp. B-10]|nr:hypothetical protein LP420_23465 [Massilia sp. B-10]
MNEETRASWRWPPSSTTRSILARKTCRRRQNRTVGVVVPFDSESRQHLTDPFFLSILGALADALAERGLDMLLSRVAADQIDSTAQPFDTGRVIGIILVGQWRQHEQLNGLAARQVPIVVWGAQLPQQLYTTVGGDNVSGGMLATSHLIEHGRRRIAFSATSTCPKWRSATAATAMR